MPRALYLHVPFCPKICPYCDFHKMRRHEGLVAAYLARLEAEAEALHARFPRSLETVYFGGGTPSYLTDAELARLVGVLERTWGFPAARETTLEADPLTFDAARLEFFRALGFSRLSIGLQSSQDAVLRFLGRRHGGAEGLEAVELALAAGFAVSADLITAVPGQDAARDLHALAETGVPHVSVYSLTIEPHTPFALRGLRVDEAREADDFALAEAVLRGYGLERYEVSSHARPGHESRHNQVYWQGEHFLNLGPSAAGFWPAENSLGVRVVNPPIKGWLAQAPPERLALTPERYVEDLLMTGLRTRAGVDLAAVSAKSGLDVAARYRELIARFGEAGLLELTGHTLRATPAGLLKLNGVLRAFFAQPSPA